MHSGHHPMARCHCLPSNQYNQASVYLISICLLVTYIGISVQEARDMEVEPVYYYVGCYTARTDLLKESVYAKTPQTCIEICEHQEYNYAVLAAEKCFCAIQVEPHGKQDDQLCHTRCLANKAQYCGGVGVHSYYSTTLLRRPALQHLRVVDVTENSISIAWHAYEYKKPMRTGAAEVLAPKVKEISHILIKCHVVKTYSTQSLFPQPEFRVQSTETRFELTDLHPATQYNISVRATCVQDLVESECGHSTIMATTEIGIPSPAPTQPKILSRTKDTITVELAPVSNNNGPVTKLFIIVELVDDTLSQPFNEELLGSWQLAQQTGVPYYITAELDYDRPQDNRTRQFVVGDGKRYGRYTNEPLVHQQDEQDQHTHVHISLGVQSTLGNVTKTLYTRSTHTQHSTSLDEFTYATFEKGQSSVVALAVTCVIFGCCLLLSLVTYFYLRYKTCHTRNLTQHRRNAHEMTQQTPIIERENNGYLVEDELPPTLESFKQQFNMTIEGLNKLTRNSLRLNANDVIGDGRYGDIITGRLIEGDGLKECALHVLSMDDLPGGTKTQLLRDLGQLAKLRRHELLLDFYGISASPDWLYLVFELQNVSLKRRLIESRQAAPAPRLTTLMEQQVLQWMYELSSALLYLGSCHVLHGQLSGYSIYVCTDYKVKVSLLGPLHYVNSSGQQLDLARWSAPEVLRHHHYTSKSDVWSFACVAWECCALGGTLYPHLPNNQLIIEAVRTGVRPAQPAYVYADLYQLLLNCWQLEPSERIGFDDIGFVIRQLMTSPRHALCFDRTPLEAAETLPLYLPVLETTN